MISYNTEYFVNNCYFYLEEKGNKVSLYYSVEDTLTESRKKHEKVEFEKKDVNQIKSVIKKVLNNKKKYSKSEITKLLKPKKTSGEIDELVDGDGVFKGSDIPIINQTLAPRKTLDVTIRSTRGAVDPARIGYRMYWRESDEERDDIVSEIDYEKAFGREETEFLDYDDTVDTLEDMGVDNAEERADQFGKLPGEEVETDEDGDPILKQRLVEKDTLEEEQKQRMVKMLEDIVAKKSKSNSDVIKKETPISKILLKNIKSIKKIADKEGISISQLIKALKNNE
jgi:hypothetical protein